MTNETIQPIKMAFIQPRTLFKPASWVTKIDFINHLLLFNNVFLTVLSEKEGGKSTFKTLLQENLESPIKSVAMMATVTSDRESIISDMISHLQLNFTDDTDLKSLVAQVNESKEHLLILIDDAQYLPEYWIKEALEAIKSQGNFGFFHLCLFSDYSIVATLNHLASDQFKNLIHTFDLGLLNEKETRTYILERAIANRLISQPLSDEQQKQFYQLTQGNLAKINNNLESYILKQNIQKKGDNKLKLKRVGMALGASIAAGVFAMYFGIFSNVIDKPTSTVSAQITRPPEQLVSQIASWQDSSSHQLVQQSPVKVQILSDSSDAQSNDVALLDKEIVAPKIRENKQVMIRTKSNAATKSILSVKEQLNKQIKNKQIKNAALKKVTATGVTAKAVQKPVAGLYTIQLFAAHQKKDIEKFKQTNKLLVKAKMMHVTNVKGSWYLLTLGEYNSKIQAQQQAKKLPTMLAKLKPWIRSTSGLTNIG
jgi:hypothetical protein